MESIELHNLECKNKIFVSAYYGGSKHVLIFMDKDLNTYSWTTGSPGDFEVGKVYDIKAKLYREDNSLKYVKLISNPKSEHKIKPKLDAIDIIYGKTLTHA